MSDLAATTLGNYALFGGGKTPGSGSSPIASNSVDAYNQSLTRSTPTVLSVARYWAAATTIGNYALFALSARADFFLAALFLWMIPLAAD